MYGEFLIMSFMVKIKEVDEWDKILKAGGKYYFTRYAASCLVDLAITTYAFPNTPGTSALY